jgi:regulatory protein
LNEEFGYACRLLARREYSEGELRRKLQIKWPDSDEIDVVIGQLLDEGLLSDQRYSAAFIRSRVEKWQGPRKIRAELSRRAVPEDVAEQSLEAAAVDWRELASQWLARQSGISSDYQMQAKYYRRLVNRGFTHDQAMDALKGR